MQQLEIKFFYPLTEQVPLDLDYSGCEKPKLATEIGTDGPIYAFTNSSTWNTSLVASNLTLDVDTTVIKLKEPPGLCRSTILKCLGIKWEIK